jgi:hypothetical protein
MLLAFGINARPRVVHDALRPLRALDHFAEDATIVVVPDLVFSLCAALACLIVAILAAVKGAPVVALVWGLLTVGFLGRAAYGYGRMRKH